MQGESFDGCPSIDQLLKRREFKRMAVGGKYIISKPSFDERLDGSTAPKNLNKISKLPASFALKEWSEAGRIFLFSSYLSLNFMPFQLKWHLNFMSFQIDQYLNFMPF